MILSIITGILLLLIGLYSVIFKKIPLIKKYNGVRNITLHCRIEGGAVMLVGIFIICHGFLQFQPGILVMAILGIGIMALVLEVILKAV